LRAHNTILITLLFRGIGFGLGRLVLLRR
jgi:hypothetical protein